MYLNPKWSVVLFLLIKTMMWWKKKVERTKENEFGMSALWCYVQKVMKKM